MGLRSDIYKGKSQRSTGQRELINDILKRSEGHLDADEIYRRARQRLASISLSTVYRNLRVFKKLGLIEQHQFGSHYFYETATRVRHHHLVCLGCGRVFEFKCPLTEHLKTKISQEEGFKVTETDVRLAGYCPDCQQRLSINNNEDTTISCLEEVR